MTNKAYLDNVQAKTGQSPDDFVEVATKRGFVKGVARWSQSKPHS